MGIYIEMNLFFDNNFDVYKIERILNIKPSDCKRKNETSGIVRSGIRENPVRRN